MALKMDKLNKIGNLLTAGAVVWFITTHSIRISYGILCFMIIHELGHVLSSGYYGRFLGVGFYYGQPAVRAVVDDDDESEIVYLSGLIGNAITGIFIFPIFFEDSVVDIWVYAMLCIIVSMADIISFLKIRKTRKNIGWSK